MAVSRDTVRFRNAVDYSLFLCRWRQFLYSDSKQCSCLYLFLHPQLLTNRGYRFCRRSLVRLIAGNLFQAEYRSAQYDEERTGNYEDHQAQKTGVPGTCHEKSVRILLPNQSFMQRKVKKEENRTSRLRNLSVFKAYILFCQKR